MVYMLESQIRYLRQGIVEVLREDEPVSVRDDVQARYNEGLQAKLSGSVWQTGGCHSWYQNAAGRNVALWPDFTFAFRRRLRRFRKHREGPVVLHATARSRVDCPPL